MVPRRSGRTELAAKNNAPRCIARGRRLEGADGLRIHPQFGASDRCNLMSTGRAFNTIKHCDTSDLIWRPLAYWQGSPGIRRRKEHARRCRTWLDGANTRVRPDFAGIQA
jgi:hypothetical protein